MKLITFEGRFNADQMMAIALLRMACKNELKIIRRRTTDEDNQDPGVLVVSEPFGPDRPASNTFNSGVSVLEGHQEWCRIRFKAPEYWRFLQVRLIVPVSELESGANCLVQDEIPPQINEVVSWFNHADQGFDKALAFVETLLVATCMAARAADWAQEEPDLEMPQAGYPGRCICG